MGRKKGVAGVGEASDSFGFGGTLAERLYHRPAPAGASAPCAALDAGYGASGDPVQDLRRLRVGREKRFDRELGEGNVERSAEHRGGAEERKHSEVGAQTKWYDYPAVIGLVGRLRITLGHGDQRIGFQFRQQLRQDGIGGGGNLLSQTHQDVSAPLRVILDSRAKPVGVKAQSQNVDWRLQQPRVDAGEQQVDWRISRNHRPVSVDRESRIRAVTRNHQIDGGARLSQGGIIKASLGIHGRVTRR